MATNVTAATVLPSVASHAPVNIWRVDYNATVAKEAAMGWQGLGYVLGLNAAMFLVAFTIFQLYAKSSRFSLFRFHTATVLSAPSRRESFTLRKWVDLLWRTPIRDTDVERQLGPEGTFYLLYELYTCKLLVALSVYAFLVLLPLYLSLGMDHRSVADDVAAATGGSASAMHYNSTIVLPRLLRAAAETLVPTLLLPPAAVSANASALLPATDAAAAVPGEEDKWWSFTHATIRSVPNESPYLWVPVVTCYVFTIAFALLLRKLGQLSSIPSGSVRAASPAPSEHDALLAHAQESSAAEAAERLHLVGMQPSELSLRSLFINRGLPKTLREERFLYIMHEVFPGYVEDVSVVLNMAAFHRLQHARHAHEDALQRARLLRERHAPLSWSLWLLPGSMKLPYVHRLLACRRAPDEHELERRIADARAAETACLERLLQENNGAGRAFIIFKSPRLRARFVRRVRNQSIMSILARFPEDALPRMVRYVRELGVTRWHMSTAPEPDDVDWDSVAFPFVKRTVVVVLVNVAILALLFVFTSPIAVTSAISNTQSYTDAASSVSNFVARVSAFVESFSPQMAKMMVAYVPTLVLVCINAVLLNVLQSAGRLQPIATDSAKERMILRTAAVYLIFNTIFVPSLAFVSIDAVLLYLNRDGEVLDLLGTLFLHNSGIFYVYYVLQRCFLGTAVNLLRVSEYAKFSWEKPRAITPREHVEAVAAWPFFTGTQMAIQISMITVVLTFSTVVPLILPIGALYFAMQHAVDKYSLLHVRPRIKGRGSIARTATHATVVSLLMYQGAMSGFFLVRGTKMQSTSVLALLMLTYILALWWYIRDKERAFVQTTKGHAYPKATEVKAPAAAKAASDDTPLAAAAALPPIAIQSLADAVAVKVEADADAAAACESALSDGGRSIDEPEPPQQQQQQQELERERDNNDNPPATSPSFQLAAEKAALRNEMSALLLLAAQHEAPTADAYEEPSDLYREPALRHRKKLRAPIRSMDSRVDQSYGSMWRHVTGGAGAGSDALAPRSPAPSTIPEEP